MGSKTLGDPEVAGDGLGELCKLHDIGRRELRDFLSVRAII